MIAMAYVKTLELFKGGKGDSIVANGGAAIRTGFEGYVGASTENPDCPIRKKDEHKQRTVENTILKGKLADNDAQTCLLEDQVQSLKDIGASMGQHYLETDLTLRTQILWITKTRWRR